MSTLSIEEVPAPEQDALQNAISELSLAFDKKYLLPETLQTILIDVIKPLFAATANANLNTSGRKSLISPLWRPPQLNSPLGQKPWKQQTQIWELFDAMMASYLDFAVEARRQTIDTQFYLLVPPILALIDDNEIIYKARGCHLLHELGNIISSCQSNVLTRSGLVDIFEDSLKANFMHLPSLTDEKDSLLLLSVLYPAFTALIDAAYPNERPGNQRIQTQAHHRSKPTNTATSTSTITGLITITKAPSNTKTSTPSRSETKNAPQSQLSNAIANQTHRTTILTTILRSGLLASLAHLSDTSPTLSTLLLNQIARLIPMLGFHSAKFLPQLVPLCTRTMVDPLSTAAPALLSATLAVVDALTAEPGVRERVGTRWWAELLRGLVGCWVNLRQDSQGVHEGTEDTGLESKLIYSAAQLGSCVERETWLEAVSVLVGANPQLSDLLNG